MAEQTPIPAAVIDAVTADLNRALGMRVVHRDSVADALFNAAPALLAAGRTAAAADALNRIANEVVGVNAVLVHDAEQLRWGAIREALAARVAENGADRHSCSNCDGVDPASCAMWAGADQ